MQSIAYDPNDPYGLRRQAQQNNVEVLEYCAESDAPKEIQNEFWGIFSKQHAVTNLKKWDLIKLEVQRESVQLMHFTKFRRDELGDFNETLFTQMDMASNSLWKQSEEGLLLRRAGTTTTEIKNNSAENKGSWLDKLLGWNNKPQEAGQI